MPIIFSNLNSNCSNVLDLQEQVKKAFSFKNCSDLLLFEYFFFKFSGFSLELQKFFSITRTIFSHSRTEQFWKQNTISTNLWLHCGCWQGFFNLTSIFPSLQTPLLREKIGFSRQSGNKTFFFVFSQQYRRKLYLETYVFGSSSIWTCRI
jgi:hypothetical protein